MRVLLLSNQGLMGGGEVMLLNVAGALRDLGHEPVVVAPSHQPELLSTAHRAGHRIAGINSRGRADYLLALRRWARRQSPTLLWANGFLPATATSGLSNRVVHLHQVPARHLQPLVPAALHRATAVIAPSQWVADRVPGAEVLANWTQDLSTHADGPVPRPIETPIRVGFLGRMTLDKGIQDLVAAANAAQSAAPQIDLQVHIGGETRFGDRNEERTVSAVLAASHVPIVQHGWVSPADFLSTIDVLAVPSNWGEAFGLVAAEALSARVPVIVSDDGALPEVVGADHSYIVRAGDVDDLARALVRFTDERKQGAIVDHIDASRRRWEELFSPQAGRTRLEALLSRIEGAV